MNMDKDNGFFYNPYLKENIIEFGFYGRVLGKLLYIDMNRFPDNFCKAVETTKKIASLMEGYLKEIPD